MAKSFINLSALERNQKIDEFRRRATRREVSLELLDQHGVSSEGPASGSRSLAGTAAADIVLLREVREMIQSTVNSLPLRQGTAVRLKYFEGLSTKAIATQTGLPLRTIEKDLQDGRMSVEKSLVRGGIFHPEFGLAGLALAIPSRELLSLSHGATAAGVPAGAAGIELVSSGFTGAGLTGGGYWSSLAKGAVLVLGLVLTGSILSTIAPDRRAASDDVATPQALGVMGDDIGSGSLDKSSAAPDEVTGPGMDAGRISATAPRANDQASPQESGVDDNRPVDPVDAGPPALPVALTLSVTDHGKPVSGMTFSINYLEDNGKPRVRRAKGPDSLLYVVEQPAGVYSVHGEHVDKTITIFAEAPKVAADANGDPVNMTCGPYTIAIERLIQETPETISVSLQTEQCCVDVKLVEGKDYGLDRGIYPSGHFKLVTNLQPAVWLESHARGDHMIETVVESSGACVMRWTSPYDGQLTFLATQPYGGEIRLIGRGGIDNWKGYPSKRAACK